RLADAGATALAGITLLLELHIERLLARLGGVPQRLRDDAQLRDVDDAPLGSGIEARDALAGIGVLDVLEAVPDEAADIERGVEDAGAALAVAVDRRLRPGGAARPGDALAVEGKGNRAGRDAGGVVAEDAVDHLGLRRVDEAVAAVALAILVGVP